MSNTLFERLHIRSLIREWFTGVNPGVGNGDALADVIERRLGRVASAEAAGIDHAAAFVQSRLDAYVEDHGIYEPSTNVIEFPGNGDEYVEELETIIDCIRGLAKNRDLDARLSALSGDGKLVEALEWYAEKVGSCRKNSSEGNDARAALDADCGDRARAALADRSSKGEAE